MYIKSPTTSGLLKQSSRHVSWLSSGPRVDWMGKKRGSGCLFYPQQLGENLPFRWSCMNPSGHYPQQNGVTDSIVSHQSVVLISSWPVGCWPTFSHSQETLNTMDASDVDFAPDSGWKITFPVLLEKCIRTLRYTTLNSKKSLIASFYTSHAHLKLPWAVCWLFSFPQQTCTTTRYCLKRIYKFALRVVAYLEWPYLHECKFVRTREYNLEKMWKSSENFVQMLRWQDRWYIGHSLYRFICWAIRLVQEKKNEKVSINFRPIKNWRWRCWRWRWCWRWWYIGHYIRSLVEASDPYMKWNKQIINFRPIKNWRWRWWRWRWCWRWWYIGHYIRLFVEPSDPYRKKKMKKLASIFDLLRIGGGAGGGGGGVGGGGT